MRSYWPRVPGIADPAMHAGKNKQDNEPPWENCRPLGRIFTGLMVQVGDPKAAVCPDSKVRTIRAGEYRRVRDRHRVSGCKTEQVANRERKI
jgi:hypothetical protein